MATKCNQCSTCGGVLEIKEGVRICTYCGNTYPLSNPQLEDELATANVLRECTRFDEAAGLYKEIIKKRKTEDISEAYWSLLLCEQRVMFEEDGKGERFPSFYAITDEDVEDSMYYSMAVSVAERFNPERAKIFEDLAKKMTRAKQLYSRIASSAKPYDVFICFKKTADVGGDTPDTALATDLYNHFAKDYHIFFSERSLRDVVVRDYEPNIYYALYTAKVLLVLCSKKEYVESQWVKNEWSRFHAFAQNPAAGKSIIPVFLEDFTPTSLPKGLMSYQGVKADYHLFETLSSTLRNILKPVDMEAELDKRMQELLEQQKQEQQKQQKQLQEQIERLSHQAQSATSNDIDTLVERLNMFLEEGDWENATAYATRALEVDPKNTKALLGLLLTDLKLKNMQELSSSNLDFENNKNYQRILRSQDRKMADELQECLRQIKARLEEKEKERKEIRRKKWKKRRRIALIVLLIVIVAALIPITLYILSVYKVREEGLYKKVSGAYHLVKAYDVAGEVVIPSSIGEIFVVAIEGDAFAKCNSVKAISIPGSVRNLEKGLLQNCSNLEELTLPFLGANANDANGYLGYIFGGSTAQAGSAYVPESLKTVIVKGGNAYRYAFYNCASITQVKLPSTATSIGECAFFGCSSLQSFTVPENVTDIGANAFFGCASLEKVTVGKSVTSIGAQAFGGCNALKNAQFEMCAGWLAYRSENARGISIVPGMLANTGTAARYLQNEYVSYIWECLPSS